MQLKPLVRSLRPLVLASPLLLAACGGDPLDLFPPPPLAGFSQLDPSVDGYVRSDGSAELDGTRGVAAGDNGGDQGVRGVLRFEVARIAPVGATLQQVHLELKFAEQQGNPFAAFGDLRVDPVDFGAAVEGWDYASPGVAPSYVALLQPNATARIDVTALVKDALGAGRPYIDFLLRFPGPGTDGDGLDDFVLFNDTANHLPGQPVPNLVATYLEPQ